MLLARSAIGRHAIGLIGKGPLQGIGASQIRRSIAITTIDWAQAAHPRLSIFATRLFFPVQLEMMQRPNDATSELDFPLALATDPRHGIAELLYRFCVANR